MRLIDVISPSEKELQGLAKNMKHRRLELGLTYQNLADRVGLSKSTLQRYETGTTQNIPISKLKLLANGLNTSVEDLLGWEGYGKGSPSSDSAFQDLLSFLGYELETTEVPDEIQADYINAGYQLEGDGQPNIVWIRKRQTNKSYQVSWDVIRQLNQEICNYAEFLTEKVLSQAEEIERPTTWYPVDFSE